MESLFAPHHIINYFPMNYGKILSFIFFLSAAAFVTNAQAIKKQSYYATDDNCLLKVNGKPYSKDEFKRVFLKNGPKNDGSLKKTIEDYFPLFINFKLKVTEAEELDLDKGESFKSELEGYAKQLKGGFRTPVANVEPLMREAYDRMRYVVRASHILIKLDAKAVDEDTLAAYNKCLELRDKIKNGEDFSELAKQYSDDPGAKTNSGDLGYFTVFSMVYSFESAAYNTPVGEISFPVRTRFGYHLIKVIDKKQNPGEILVKHIMIKVSDKTNEKEIKDAKEKADLVYSKLKRGEKFDDLVLTYSDDKTSAKNNGKLQWFSLGKMPDPNFEAASFALKYIGDYCKPVKSSYGWHIIELVDVKKEPSYEEYKAEIKNKLMKDERVKTINPVADEIIESNPEYISLLNEYREGILLFNLTDKKVWSKAVKDKDGLENFYNNNRNKYGPGEMNKAIVTADYQNFLETEWLKELRRKYKVIVNQTVYDRMIEELEREIK